ncbi:hypothetical protein ACWEO2_34375 [Nocardia sp. NPDC004278]
MDEYAVLRVPRFRVLADGIVTDPVAIARTPECVDVVAIDDRNRICHLVVAAGTARIVERLELPAPPVGRPTIGSWGADRLDVFVRDVETRLWHCEFDGRWGPPRLARSVGAVSDASFVSWSRGRFDVFSTGADGVLEHYWYQQPIGLMGPESLARPVVGQPAVVVTSLYGLEVVARGSFDGVLRRQYHVPEERTHEWTSTPMLPGRTTFDVGPDVAPSTGESLRCTGDPTLVWCRGVGAVENRLVAFARQEDRLVQFEPGPDWPTGRGNRVLTGPAVASDPVAVSARPCRVDVFFGVSEGTIGWLTSHTGGSSARYRVLDDGIRSVGRPAVCSSRPDRLELFVRTAAGELRTGRCEVKGEQWNAYS